MNDHLDCYIQVPMYSSLTPVLELPKTLFYVREMLRSKYLDPFKLSLMTLLKKGNDDLLCWTHALFPLNCCLIIIMFCYII